MNSTSNWSGAKNKIVTKAPKNMFSTKNSMLPNGTKGTSTVHSVKTSKVLKGANVPAAPMQNRAQRVMTTASQVSGKTNQLRKLSK